MGLSPKKKEEIVTRVMSYIREGESHCSQIHRRVLENQEYERGYQWSKGDTERQALRERPAIPQNSILKIINAVANREMVNRFEPRVYGRSESDSGIAQVLDASGKWQRDQAETEHEESMAFRSAVASGFGCMHKWFDGGVWGGEGQIKDEEIPIWNMLWPLRARKMDLVDRRWHVFGKIIGIPEAEYAFGDKPDARKWFNRVGKERVSYRGTVDEGIRSNARAFSAFSWQEIKDGFWYNLAEDQVFIVEAEWIDTKKVWRCAKPVWFDDAMSLSLGETESFEFQLETPEGPQPVQVTADMLSQPMPNGSSFLKTILQQSAIEVFEDKASFTQFAQSYKELTGEDFEDYNPVTTEVIKYALILDDVVIDHGERPYGFTYEFMTGWRLENTNEIDFYGVVDVAKGPQDFKNAILSNMLTVYMSSPKNTLIMAESLVNNTEDFENNFARPLGVVFVKDEFFTEPQKWLKLDPPSFPSMQPELVALANDSVQELFGLSSIDLGSQSDLRRVSGTVVQSAQMAGNTIVAVFFDALRRYRKRYGMLNLKFMVQHYTPTQLLRIIGDEYSPDIEILNEQTWGDMLRYDVKVEESPTSTTEQMETLSKLQQVGSLDAMMDRGDIDFEDYLDFIPTLPQHLKRRLKDKHQYKEQINQQLSEMQTNMDVLNAEHQMLMQFLQQQGGGEILTQFQQLLTMAQPMAQQLMAAQEEQPEQGTAPQNESPE